MTGPNQYDPGGITIRLANLSCPTDFTATSNNGGAYKVWVTPVSSFIGLASNVDNPCGSGCFHGFVPSASKTDNFKVNTAPATFCLTIQKLFLQSDNVTLVPQPGWEFDVLDPLNVLNKYYTDTTGQVVVCDLAQGSYTVSEIIPPTTPPTVVVGLIVNNAPVLPPVTSYTFNGQSAVGIVFINQVQALPPPPPPA